MVGILAAVYFPGCCCIVGSDSDFIANSAKLCLAITCKQKYIGNLIFEVKKNHGVIFFIDIILIPTYLCGVFLVPNIC